MNKISSVHLFQAKPEQCSTCGMSADDSDGCCHDEEQIIKLVQDQRPPVTLHYALEAPSTLDADFTVFSAISLWDQERKVVKTAHDPPRYSLPDIYLRNRVFRI